MTRSRFVAGDFDGDDRSDIGAFYDDGAATTDSDLAGHLVRLARTRHSVGERRLWHADRALRVNPTEPTRVQRAVRVTARKLPCGAATPRVRPPRSLRLPDRHPPCRG
jgi:hypothetical protein